MTYEAIDAVLDVLEYKDGYDLRRVDDELHVSWWGRDSRADYGAEAVELKSFLFSVPIDRAVRRWRDPKSAANWLRTQIHRLECHEADEFIRVDGELWFDPHRGEA